MEQVTLKTIGNLLDERLKPIKDTIGKMATQESLDDLNSTVNDMKKTLNRHTTILEKDATAEKNKHDEETTNSHRIDVAEKHINQLSRHVDLKLEY